MPVLEGKRMTIFIAPKKVPVVKKESKPAEDASAAVKTSEEKVKATPSVRVQKEYTGPKVEGEDFWKQ